MTRKLEYNMNRYRLLSGNLVRDVEQFERAVLIIWKGRIATGREPKQGNSGAHHPEPETSR